MLNNVVNNMIINSDEPYIAGVTLTLGNGAFYRI